MATSSSSSSGPLIRKPKALPFFPPPDRVTPQVKDKFSGFLITINTNRKPKGVMNGSNPVIRALYQLMDSFGSNESNSLALSIKWLEKGTTQTDSDEKMIGLWNENIKEIEAKHRVEVGPHNHRAHAHMFLTIRHSISGIHLDVARIKQQLNRLVRENNIEIFPGVEEPICYVCVRGCNVSPEFYLNKELSVDELAAALRNLTFE